MKEAATSKILIVARMSPRLNSRTRRLVRTLSKTHLVTIVSESLDRMHSGIYEVDGGVLHEIVLPLHNQRIWYLSGAIRVMALNLKGLQMSLREAANVIVCSDSIYALPGIVNKLLLRRGFVYNSHEMMWALGTPWVLSTLLGWLERIAIDVCDFWLVPSEERATLILEKHKLNKRYLVYENLPISGGSPDDRSIYRMKLQQAGVPEDAIVVMFQGSITRKRGLEDLVRAANSGAFHLVIQGQGDLLSILHGMGGEHVTFVPPCPNDEVVSWLSAADASFVYYENDCLNSAYACSNKFYGSVMAGTPVLCNRLPAFEAFAEHHGGVAFIDDLTAESVLQCVKLNILVRSKYNELKQQVLTARKALENSSREENIIRSFVEL